MIESLQEYKHALGLPPQDQSLESASRYFDAHLLVAHGRIDDAIAAYKRLLELTPDEASAYEDLVRLYTLLDAEQEAVVVLLALADAYARQGRPERVRQTYERAAALAPNDAEIRAKLAAAGVVPASAASTAPVSPVAPPSESRPTPPRPSPPASPPPRPSETVTLPARPDAASGTAAPPDAAAVQEAAATPTAPPPPRPTEGPRRGTRGTRPAAHEEQVAESSATGTAAADRVDTRPNGRTARVTSRKTENLGDILLSMGMVTDEQLAAALEIRARTGERLGQIFIDQKILSDAQLAMAMGQQWGFRYASLRETSLDADAVKLVPHSLALRLRVIPIGWRGGRLVVAITDPLNVIAIDDVRLITGHEVEPVITTEDELMTAINRSYQVEAIVEAAPQMEGDVLSETEEEVSLEQLKVLVDDAPVVRLVNTIIEEGIREGASDIHIEPQRGGVLVRYRIDGVLNDALKPPKHLRAPLTSRVKIMAEMDIAERRKPQDGRIHLRSNGRNIDLRISTLPTIFGEKVVMRLLDQSTPLIGLNHLGFHSETLRRWEDAITKPYGMVLVTGPTGSGKTTTLYATLGTINTLEKNIVTVEDPVEYQLPRINQVQVNVKAGMTFAGGLRSILRQDPDIIMVGEIRDRETAEISVQAALTGHLVFSTLHTNDAPGTINRLTDMEIEPFLVSSSVIAILAQRLARQICPHCKISYSPPPDALQSLGLQATGEVVLYRGEGCESCRFTGYKGRIAVFELLEMTDTLRELVVRRASAHELKSQAVRDGMRALQADGLDKVLSGVSTIDEILRVVYVGG